MILDTIKYFPSSFLAATTIEIDGNWSSVNCGNDFFAPMIRVAEMI